MKRVFHIVVRRSTDGWIKCSPLASSTEKALPTTQILEVSLGATICIYWETPVPVDRERYLDLVQRVIEYVVTWIERDGLTPDVQEEA